MSQQPSSTANHLKGSQWKKRMNKVKIQWKSSKGLNKSSTTTSWEA